MTKEEEEEKIARGKRLKEWQGWLKRFRTYSSNRGLRVKFNYVPNAAKILNDLYWHLAEEYIRPLLKQEDGAAEKHRIHPYKIIAVSEIAVMMTEPINVHGNEEMEKYMNAVFAWYVATQIIENWDTGSAITISTTHIEQVAGFTENIDTTAKYPVSFAEEHIQWLTLLNVTVEKPLLLIAQCWRLFYITCLAVAAKGKLK